MKPGSEKVKPLSESSLASVDETLPVQLFGGPSRLVPVLLCSLVEVQMAWEEAEDDLVKLSNRPFWLVCFVFPSGPFWSSIRPYNSARCVYNTY